MPSVSPPMSQSSPASPSLTTPAQFLRGVGPERAELLKRLGIRTGQDALFYFPRDYQPPAKKVPISGLREQVETSIVAQITEIDHRVTQAGKSIAGILVEDQTGAARLLFFNQPFRLDELHRGDVLLITGVPKMNGLRFEFVHPKVVKFDAMEDAGAERILPIYPLTEGLKQSSMRRIMEAVSDQLASEVPEVLPESVRQEGRLLGIADALKAIHFPASDDALRAARRRLIFQEFLVQQLALAVRRRRLTTDLKSPPLQPTPEINAAIFRRFGFALTGDQKRAIDDVGRDMSRQFPMNRLIQGDVGSGKTVVAQYAMLLSVAHKHQAVLMAPTDILARQHLDTFTDALKESRVRIGLFTGSVGAAERRRVCEAAAAGEIDLLIGTHALLYGEISLPKLGLVVIDEQHKFGVNQRAGLRGDGLAPHYLVLSATPIPRTVAMTMFGDLELSTLKDKPPGRGVVKTYLARDGWRQRWWKFVAERLDEGRQVFVVTPLVTVPKAAVTNAEQLEANEQDADAQEDPSSAEKVYEELRTGDLKNYRIGLLHGRMSSEAKSETMQRFARGEIQVLVTTTVIEVGINVPNATVMTVLGAERFGLAQLHQLRGRIIRGNHTGHMGVFTDGAGSAEENERLQVLASTDDGFELAEADYRLRGSGDLMGTRQSGISPWKVANPLRDADILAEARLMAQDIVDQDPDLEAEGFAKLKQQVMRRYGKVLELGDVA